MVLSLCKKDSILLKMREGGEIPELRLLLEAERVHQQTELGWMGPVGSAQSLAPTGNNVGIRLEQ